MSECVIEDFNLDASTLKKLITKFVNDELCPCARETFVAYETPNVEHAKDALFMAVINEMVLRATATEVASKAA